jgi:hypothetical protein
MKPMKRLWPVWLLGGLIVAPIVWGLVAQPVIGLLNQPTPEDKVELWEIRDGLEADFTELHWTWRASKGHVTLYVDNLPSKKEQDRVRDWLSEMKSKRGLHLCITLEFSKRGGSWGTFE